MAISGEILNFSDLIKPLATNQSLEKLFLKPKEEILKKQAKPINALEGQIGLQKNMSDQLEINCDNNEQYSRRTSIWIHGIEVPENESIDNVVAVVKSCHERVNVLFDQDNIDHVHRAGKKYTYENTGNKIQSVIVKINLWKSLKEFYDARPRNFVNGMKRPGPNFSNVFVDLTRKR